MNMNFLTRKPDQHPPQSSLHPPQLQDHPEQFDTPAGMMTPEQLERTNEVSVNGKSSLMHLAHNFKHSVEAAERQHAQSLQEVINAQSTAVGKFSVAYEACMEKFRLAGEMAMQAQKDLEVAVKTHCDDLVDTSQMVSKLRDIRIKNPLLDTAHELTRKANQPRKAKR